MEFSERTRAGRCPRKVKPGYRRRVRLQGDCASAREARFCRVSYPPGPQCSLPFRDLVPGAAATLPASISHRPAAVSPGDSRPRPSLSLPNPRSVSGRGRREACYCLVSQSQLGLLSPLAEKHPSAFATSDSFFSFLSLGCALSVSTAPLLCPASKMLVWLACTTSHSIFPVPPHLLLWLQLLPRC